MIKAHKPLFNPYAVRAHFVLRGTSLAAWAQSHGWDRRYVWKIITGKKRGGGKLGTRIVSLLNRELKKAV